VCGTGFNCYLTDEQLQRMPVLGLFLSQLPTNLFGNLSVVDFAI